RRPPFQGEVRSKWHCLALKKFLRRCRFRRLPCVLGAKDRRSTWIIPRMPLARSGAWRARRSWMSSPACATSSAAAVGSRRPPFLPPARRARHTGPRMTRGNFRMLYAFLCYHDEAVVNGWSKEEDDAVLAKRHKVTDKLAANGK